MQGFMQIRPLSPWSQHGQENLRYFTPVDRRIFLVISYGEVDLLLNGAISLTSEILINIRYACLTMETRGWPRLRPLGLPCSLSEAGMQTPAVEAPTMLNVLWEQPANPHNTLMESLMESGSKMAETYMQVSCTKKSISLTRKIRDLTPRILHCKPLFIRLCFLQNKYSNLFDRCVAST